MSKWRCQDCEWTGRDAGDADIHTGAFPHKVHAVGEPEPEGQREWEKEYAKATTLHKEGDARWMLNRCVRQIRSHQERFHKDWQTQLLQAVGCSTDCLIRDLES